MRRLLVWIRLTLLVFAANAFVSGCTVNSAIPEKAETQLDLVIYNVTAIDALNGVRPNVDVAIADGRIVSVNAAQEKSRSSAVKSVDGTGKYLIPGLWDAHVHLAYDPEIDHEVFFPLSLAHGVTYLRDTGGHLDRLAETRAIAFGQAIAPDLYVSGPLVDGAKRVYAGQSAGSPNLSIGVASADQAMAEVDRLAANGVQFIKAYEMLAPDVFQAVVNRAKHHGLPVTAHSPLSMTATQAINAGVTDMQHLRNLEMDCVANPLVFLAEREAAIETDEADFGRALRSSIHNLQREKAVSNYDRSACAALITLMKTKGVSQTPTLTISRFLSRRLYAENRWQRSFALMPDTVAKKWMAAVQRLAKRQPTSGNLAYDKWLMAMVSDLDQAGVSILAGTDAPIGFLTPGASLHEELAMLVEAGLTPMEALKAATIAPAKFLGLQDQQGSIALNMKADLVLLNKNPLMNIRNTMSIEAVTKDGAFISKPMVDRYRKQASEIN